jgi:hypothetical protein
MGGTLARPLSLAAAVPSDDARAAAATMAVVYIAAVGVVITLYLNIDTPASAIIAWPRREV